MSRFYCCPTNVKKDYIYLKSDEAHHVYKVMRLRPKDKVIVFDGSTKEYEGVIVKANPKSVEVKIEKIKDTPSKKELQVSIAIGLPKGRKMDLIIQKCAELGVNTIIPLKTDRSLIFLDKDKQMKKIIRWRAIAREAAKQCGRIGITKIDELKSFEKVIEESKNYNFALMPCLNEKSINLKEFFKKEKPTKRDRILILIGPEGGFTQDEIYKATKTNFFLLSLGQRTLRTETAAIYMMSVISFYLESLK